MSAVDFPGSADAAPCRRSAEAYMAGAYMNAFDPEEPRPGPVEGSLGRRCAHMNAFDPKEPRP